MAHLMNSLIRVSARQRRWENEKSNLGSGYAIVFCFTQQRLTGAAASTTEKRRGPYGEDMRLAIGSTYDWQYRAILKGFDRIN